MSQLYRNLLANFLGKGWTAVVLVVTVPLYLRRLGIEAYGLIGVFATLQAVFALLDMGLSTTLNREIARNADREASEQETSDLVRTLEVIYWLVASAIVALVAVLAPLIANNWIDRQNISEATIQQAILMMGLAIGLEFPFALYSGGLIGLQKQVKLNSLVISITTLRGFGALAVIWLIAPTIQAFFVWQSLISLLQTSLCGALLWRSLPKPSNRPRFRKLLLMRIWHFAAGMTAISILSVLLTQLDRIILSKLLTLEMFGYYNLALVVASSLYMIINPIFTAIFPRLSQLVAADDKEGLRVLYHNACQLMSVLVFPIAIVIALFSKSILLIWTSDPIVAERTYLLVSLLIIGTALNSLMNIPYAKQLAYGWTKLAFYQNVCSVFILVPLLFWAANRYGAVGAAWIWILLNAGYVLFGIQAMHLRLLRSEKLRWYVQDVGLPLAATLAVVLLGRWLFPAQANEVMVILWLVPLSALSLLASALATPFFGEYIVKLFYSVRLKLTS
jgi:O-antigen/teichoic acid export membrane protein